MTKKVMFESGWTVRPTYNYGMKPFTVIIPLIPQHDYLLKEIFEDLSVESELIHEIIVSRSESFLPTALLEARFNKWAKKLNLDVEIKVDSVLKKAADGTNRARGWGKATATYIAFMDADDRYAKNRLSAILNIFEETGCDGVIHNYIEDDSSFVHVNQKSSNSLRVRLTPPKSIEEEFGTITDSIGQPLPLHYAHLSVKNHICEEINYSDRFPGADVEFCQRLITSGKVLYYTPLKLSRWSRNRSFRYKLRLLRKRLLVK
jgi:hypothetical protein